MVVREIEIVMEQRPVEQNLHIVIFHMAASVVLLSRLLLYEHTQVFLQKVHTPLQSEEFTIERRFEEHLLSIIVAYLTEL